MRLEHHLVGGYVRYISPHIIIIIKCASLLSHIPLYTKCMPNEQGYEFCYRAGPAAKASWD